MLLGICAFSSLSSVAERFQYGDLYYNTTSPNTCEVAPQGGWDENYHLSEIAIPAYAVYDGQLYSVTDIGDYAFDYCCSLTSIDIPSSVTYIGERAFGDCSSLINVNIPNSVTRIGDYAFYNCRSLTGIGIPNSVGSIGGHAFYECSSLVSIDIPGSVASIGDWAFSGCDKLTSINVAQDNTSYASLDGVLFNKHIDTILAFPGGRVGAYAIPESTTSIGISAFQYSHSLTSIDIPNSITEIGTQAFRGCDALTSISIPNSVSSIGNLAFNGCSCLQDIYNHARTPQIIDNDAFTCLYGEGFHYPIATLHVRKGYKDVYANAANWNRFTIVDDIVDDTVELFFDQAEYHCAVGARIAPIIRDFDADELEWTSSDPDILYIDPVYHFCFGLKEGVAEITVRLISNPNITATAKVIVVNETAIGNISTDGSDCETYSLNGQRINNAANGLHIVRTKGGESRKVVGN